MQATNRVWWLILWVASLVLLGGLVVLLSTNGASATPMPMSPSSGSTSYQLHWDTVAYGSMTMQSTSMTMQSTVGQEVVGSMSNSQHHMENGYWQSSMNQLYDYFLPFITRH